MVPRTRGVDNVIEGNVFRDSFGHAIWGDVNGDRHQVINNIAINTRTSAFFIESLCSENLVQGNIAVRCGAGFADKWQGGRPDRALLTVPEGEPRSTPDNPYSPIPSICVGALRW